MSESDSPPVKVLVVDDEVAICRIVCRTLDRNGFSASSVSRADELDSAVEGTTFDVILLDRSIGTPSGGSLVPLLREKAPTAKILYFTGEYLNPSDLEAVDGFVLKPINGEKLANAIRGLL